MSPEHRNRLAWLVAVGVAQIGLTAGALELCLIKTPASPRSRGTETSGRYTVSRRDFRGYPVPWLEGETSYTYPVDKGADPLCTGSRRVVGSNWVMPCALLAAALALPPALVRFGGLPLYRRRKPTPPPRFSKGAGVVLFAAVAAIATGLVEFETAQRGRTPWSVHWFGIPVRSTREYYEARSFVIDGRYAMEQKIPAARVVFEPTWSAHSRLTLVAFLSVGISGCVLFRPWRRHEDGQPNSDPPPRTLGVVGVP
jgi:hypothetical protein